MQSIVVIDITDTSIDIIDISEQMKTAAIEVML